VKVAILLLTSTIVVSVFALSAGAAKVKDAQEQCRTSEANGYSNKDVEQAIRCAVGKWSVPGGTSRALHVARCESGFNEHATYADHVGVYQHVRRYWPARFRAHRVRGWHMHRSPFNARSNVVVSIRMVHSGGWGPWSCA
jgi:hypothetical protein